jgi:hypothetical protein
MENPILLTQCFCNADILQFSMKNLYEHLELDLEHWILLKHYPINKKENERKILEYAKQYNCKVFDCGSDVGAHVGLNMFFDAHPEYIERRYIGFDPDTLVQTKGFDKALIEVANSDPSITLCGLNGLAIWTKKERLRQYEGIIAGYNVINHPNIDMCNVSLMDTRWVMKLPKRFWEPFNYYGMLESYLWENMQRDKKRLVYLLDYKEQYDGMLEQHKDPEYQAWKHDHLSGFTGSLEEWLRAKSKEHLIGGVSLS